MAIAVVRVGGFVATPQLCSETLMKNRSTSPARTFSHAFFRPPKLTLIKTVRDFPFLKKL